MGEISYPMPRTPRVGNRMTADWGGSLMRSVGSLRPVGVPGMMISRGYYGTRLTPVGGSSVRQTAVAVVEPWTVKWFEETDIPGSEGQKAAAGWCVYLPADSVSLVFEVHLVAHETAGGWWRIAGAESFGKNDAFRVWGHVKRRVLVGSAPSGVRPIDAAKCVLYADAATGGGDNAGDSWSTEVAWTASQQSGSANVVQEYVGRLVFGTEPLGEFPLYWATVAVGQSGWRTFTPHVGDCAGPFWSGGLVADAALPAAGDVSVYDLVDCTGSTPAESAGTAPSASAGVLSVLVYRLEDGAVRDDYRDRLARQIFYQ